MLIAIIIVTALLLIALGVLIWAHQKTFGSLPKGATETGLSPELISEPFRDPISAASRELAAKPCERVTTVARDGIRLGARYFHTADSAPVCICFHGYRGSGPRDFALMAPLLMSWGYNVLLVDERAHWSSGGRTITFGIRERYDVLSWVSYVNNRFGGDTPVYLFGISLGGGTVLMASGLELPDNVRAVCADCPFNSPKEIICHVADQVGMDHRWSWPIVWLSARVIGRFNINATSAEKAAAGSKKPILIIHGEGDSFVPAPMSRRVYEANPAMIEYHTFPQAEHGMSYLCDPERYQRILKEFLKKTSVNSKSR